MDIKLPLASVEFATISLLPSYSKRRVHDHHPVFFRYIPYQLTSHKTTTQKGNDTPMMKSITYTLAFVDGTVCYECLPDTPGAFYRSGSWYCPFCPEDEFFAANPKGSASV